MSVFFQFIAAFALFFGIAGLVFATEVSKRCQQLIETRLSEIEAEIARKMNKQDAVIVQLSNDSRRALAAFEEQMFAQTREINAIRKSLEMLTDDLEKRAEAEKKQRAIMRNRRA